MVRTIIWGLIVIAIGLWLWLAMLGVLGSGFSFRRYWPVIIIAIGPLTLGEGIPWAIRRRSNEEAARLLDSIKQSGSAEGTRFLRIRICEGGEERARVNVTLP